jgi:3-methyladenine DNA glycosylase AlkD
VILHALLALMHIYCGHVSIIINTNNIFASATIDSSAQTTLSIKFDRNLLKTWAGDEQNQWWN